MREIKKKFRALRAPVNVAKTRITITIKTKTMEKTLGGDRLGAGNKMKVELHNYGRSSHDLGYLWRSTMSPGTLVPFMNEIALPGDSFDINLGCDVKTHPTVGPLFGSYKVQLDIFQCPIRLYQGQLHNNKLGIGLKMSTVKLPLLAIAPQTTAIANLTDETIDWDNYQINPSSLLAHLGIRGIGLSVVGTGAAQGREFNGIDLLAYWDTYKNYYANKQEEIGYVIHTGRTAPGQNVTAVVAAPGGTIGQYPGTGPVQLGQGTEIEFQGGAGTPADLLEVTIQTELLNGTPGGSILARDLGTVIAQSLASITILYNYQVYGDKVAISWDYVNQNQLGTEIELQSFDLADIDTMRERILAHSVNPTPFMINTQALDPYQLMLEVEPVTGFRSILGSQEGLGIKTYNSDLLNNWLQTEWIDGVDGITAITAIDTSGGEFTIDTLNLAKKVYDMLNRIAVSGGSYNDWLDAVYTRERYTSAENPMYMGGLIKELVFQEVVSNSEAGATGGPGGTQPLGTLAGKGIMSGKHKGGVVHISVKEPSLVLGIISITPRLDYSQGNQWHVNLKTMDDLHKPALDQIGFQELITEKMAWWDTHEDATGAWIQKSAGKQPAWMDYMTNINRVRGNFAIKDNEMFMVLNRRYEAEANGVIGMKIKDLTTYIDPRKFNHIFAETSLDSQNFWAQISVDMTVRRMISAKIMPNL